MPSQRQRPGPVAKTTAARRTKGTGVRQAYETIRGRIVTLDLTPGADLDESRLVRDLGLSRTPVREALVRLAAEGLVVMLPNRTARVAPLGLSDVKEHLEAFELIQRAATRFAAHRRTETDLDAMAGHCAAFDEAVGAGDVAAMIQANWRFHQAIGAAAGNRHIGRYYEQLLTDGLRIANLAMGHRFYGKARDRTAHVRAIQQEHRQMVAAIRAGDADKAESLAASHTQLARKRSADFLALSLAAEVALGESVTSRKPKTKSRQAR